MSKHNRERRRKASQHNYGPAVLAVVQQALDAGQVKAGELYTISVVHDGWCALMAGTGPCDCNPKVRYPQRVPAPEEN